MNKDSKIFVAGHRGMVGSAICRKLLNEGFSNILTASSSELDLRNQAAVANFFKTNLPEYVVLAAAKVGGIKANDTYRAEFIYDNLAIQNNVIHFSHVYGVKKLLFLGSSCIYPKLAPQPLKEEYLLTGLLEATNEPYAIAKIAGIKMCEAYRDQYASNFICAMPTNLYGPNDNYDLENAHVLPSLIRKFHEAKVKATAYVEIWGSGTPKREFLHVDDLADACFLLLQNYNEKLFVNVGCGTDLSILELATLIKNIVAYKGEIKLNTSKPDGTPKKLMDISRIKNLGWSPKISLESGIKTVYEQYQNALKK